MCHILHSDMRMWCIALHLRIYFCFFSLFVSYMHTSCQFQHSRTTEMHYDSPPPSPLLGTFFLQPVRSVGPHISLYKDSLCYRLSYYYHPIFFMIANYSRWILSKYKIILDCSFSTIANTGCTIGRGNNNRRPMVQSRGIHEIEDD